MNRARNSRKHGGTPRRGFTAIELLVVVAIVGVLATLVVPSYAGHAARSRILDAALRLADHRAKMESYFLDRRAYLDAAGGCGVAPAPAGPGDVFELGCEATATTYRVTATGRAGSVVSGFAYAIDETGARATLSVPAGWGRTADCWTSRPDGSCL